MSVLSWIRIRSNSFHSEGSALASSSKMLFLLRPKSCKSIFFRTGEISLKYTLKPFSWIKGEMWDIFFHFERSSVTNDTIFFGGLWIFANAYYCFMRDRIACNIANYLTESCNILIYTFTWKNLAIKVTHFLWYKKNATAS